MLSCGPAEYSCESSLCISSYTCAQTSTLWNQSLSENLSPNIEALTGPLFTQLSPLNQPEFPAAKYTRLRTSGIAAYRSLQGSCLTFLVGGLPDSHQAGARELPGYFIPSVPPLHHEHRLYSAEMLNLSYLLGGFPLAVVERQLLLVAVATVACWLILGYYKGESRKVRNLILTDTSINVNWSIFQTTVSLRISRRLNLTCHFSACADPSNTYSMRRSSLKLVWKK